MSKPYDVTSKDLIEADPAGWVQFVGGTVTSGAVRLVDADISTVSTAADKVIRVDGPSPWLLHLEFQAAKEGGLARRFLQYNALLQHRHGLPVATVAVLLRDKVGAGGRLRVRPPVGPSWEFRYEVVRVWDRPADDFLGGPLAVLPLAPIAAVGRRDLPAVIDRMRDRLGREADRPLQHKLWTATYLLLGLRYPESFIDNLLQGVIGMEESVTYQALVRRGLQQGLQQGATAEARRLVLLAAGRKFGAPPPAAEAAVNAVPDTAALETLLTRVFTATTWDELLKPE